MRFKTLKQNSIKSLKKNYVLTTIMCIVGFIFLSWNKSTRGYLYNGLECFQNYFDSGYFATNSTIYYINSNIDNLDFAEINELSDSELQAKGFINKTINYIRAISPDVTENQDLVQRFKIRDGVIKPILVFTGNDYNVFYENIENISLNYIGDNISNTSVIVAIGGMLFWIIYKFFIANILTVGYYRFFLENSKYHKTRMRRLYYGFRHNYLNVFRSMFKKDFFLFLWNFTIIGAIIKSYSYSLVPYILAENKNTSSKDVITLSRKLMKGYKFKAFLLDLSFLGWDTLNMLSLGFCGLFFLNAYKEGTYAEFYKAIINENKDKDFYKKALNGKNYFDEDLYIEDEKDYYKGTERPSETIAMQNYSIKNIVLFFFIFAFAGWCWEVILFLIMTNTFINRGTLMGPWLPIYGFGGILILVLFTKTKLRKYLNNPMILFLLIAIISGALEYISSWLIEIIVGLRYWDYVGHFLNINGRICFESLCEFGLGGLIAIYAIGPRLNKYISQLKTKTIIITISILTTFILIDFTYSKAHPRVGYGITGALINESGEYIKPDNK